MIKINLKPFTQYFCDMLSASISPCSGRGACSIWGDCLHPSVTGWLAIVSGLHGILILWNILLFISQRSPNMPTSFILISDYCYCVCMCGGTEAELRVVCGVRSLLSFMSVWWVQLRWPGCDTCLCLLSRFTWPLLPFTSLLFLLCLCLCFT